MKIKSLSNLSLFATNVLVASLIVFQGQISTAESGSYRRDLLAGVYQIISYQYTTSPFTSAVSTIWKETNYGKTPTIKASSNTKNISVTGGLNWELAQISYQSSYSSTDNTTYTISPKMMGILKFYWEGSKITSGTVTKETHVPLASLFEVEYKLSAKHTSNIGGGKLNLVPHWEYSEVKASAPEPLTISGTGVALVFGVLLKKRAYLKSRT